MAIIRTIGRMAWRGSSVETEISHLLDPNNQIYDFCFSKTIALIQPGDAYQLFMTLALFVNKVSREALGCVAGLGDDAMRRDEGLSDLEVLSLCDKNEDAFGLEPLTRTQALVELHAHPEVEAEARERWVGWYVDFTQRYGGRDEQEMHLRYDHLEADWDNILSVMEWCVNHARYADVVTLWNHVRDFTHIYGFWTDRLSLLDWIIGEAESRDDDPKTVWSMYDKAFTLTLTGPSTRLEEADALLERCWSLRARTDPVLQAKVAALKASLMIKQGDYAQAHDWLDTGEALLREAQIAPIELARERTSLLFDRGETWLMMGDYAQAQAVFEEMLEQGKISGWQRSIAHAQNWLAYTAILQNDCPSSEQYLHMGWSVPTASRRSALNAYFKRTFAYYYQKIGSRQRGAQVGGGRARHL